MFSTLRNTRDLKIKVTHAFNFVFSLFILQKRICGKLKRLTWSRILWSGFFVLIQLLCIPSFFITFITLNSYIKIRIFMCWFESDSIFFYWIFYIFLHFLLTFSLSGCWISSFPWTIDNFPPIINQFNKIPQQHHMQQNNELIY